MKDVDKYLNADESVENALKLSFAPFYIGFAFVALFVVAGLIFKQTQHSWVMYLMMLFAFLVLVYTLIQLEYILSTKVYITNKRVILRTGVLSTKHSDIPREKISAITIQQSLVGKMLDYSDVIIESSANITVNRAKYIKNPFEFKRNFDISG